LQNTIRKQQQKYANINDFKFTLMYFNFCHVASNYVH